MDAVLAAIEVAMQSTARVMMRPRTFEYLRGRSGVTIDRSGAALLRQLMLLGGEPIRFRDLADLLGIAAPAVTRTVQRLEEEGLVTRAQDPEDGRAFLLKPSAAGERMMRRFLDARRCWLSEVLQDWPVADRQEFARLLTRFAHDIETA